MNCVLEPLSILRLLKSLNWFEHTLFTNTGTERHKMALYFSKGFGKTRLTVSGSGINVSQGLGGGLRYGAKIAGPARKRKKTQEQIQINATLNYITIGTFVIACVIWKVFF